MNESGTHNEISGTVHGPVVQVGTLVIHPWEAQMRPICCLPPQRSKFQDRLDVVDALRRLLSDERGRISMALTGIGGVGKTATAVHLAHNVAEQFPDGQFYVDLRGSAGDGPVHPSVVLASFLSHLGIPDVPRSMADLVAKFRSVTATLRIMIVLDDAASAAQVSELLPSSRRSLVLVTSRRRLDGLRLEGFDEPIDLPPLAEPDALALVTELVGEQRAREEGPALRELVEICGGLPLALEVAATQLSTQPHLSAARFVARMRQRKDQLLKWMKVDDERLVEAVFEVCYRDLDEDAKRAYRLLGLWSGPDLDAAAAAALLGLDVLDAEDVLSGLVQACLLGIDAAGRYRFHPLIRMHARNHAEQDDDVEVRATALVRIVKHYRDFLIARDQILSTRPRLRTDLYQYLPAAYSGPDAQNRALADLRVERANLLAAVNLRLSGYTWQLCDSLIPFYTQASLFDDWITSLQRGLADAEAIKHKEATVRMWHQLGSAYFELGEDKTALRHFRQALELAEGCGYALGEQSAWEWIGLVHERLDNAEEAAVCFEHSFAALERVPDQDDKPRALALLQMNSGRVLVKVERHKQALPRLTEALAHFREYPEEAINVAKTQTSLGEARDGLGMTTEALADLDQALAAFTERGPLLWEAYVREVLGRIHRGAGHHAEADRHDAEAVRLYAKLAERRSGSR